MYSHTQRKGTQAALFLNHVHPDTIKKRCELLRELSRQKTREFMGRFVGSVVSALVEGRETRVPASLKQQQEQPPSSGFAAIPGMRNQEINVVVADRER